MTMTTEIAGLLAEARNCRKLASMTADASAKSCLEQLASRYDTQREAVEAMKAAGEELPKSKPNSLALDRVGAIEIIDEHADSSAPMAF